MSIINFRDVSISFGLKPLLDKVNFQIDERERICILGRNGMGKSTLLKLINREIKPDEGEISHAPSIITAKLEQDVPDSIHGTVYDVIAEGLGKTGSLLAAYQHLTHELAHSTDDKLLERLQKIQHDLDEHQAWNLSHKIDNVISRLSLPADTEFLSLSGGLKRRVLLGRAIVTEPTILLLDEPTNHLDIESIDWLENFLKDFNGTVIFITHDRVFLQKLATRMIEIDRGKIQSYPGNYAQYLEKKNHELEVEETHHQNFDKKLAEEEIWIRQGIKARRTRNEGRVRALEKLREIRNARREQMGKVNMQLQKAEQSGKIVIEAHNIVKTFSGKPVINHFSTTIMRGDKIGIIGPNGIGKSTLLNILLGELKPDQGEVKHGTKLEIAYSDQLRAQLDENKTVAENVSYGDQYVMVNGRSVHIIGYLQDFLFSPERSRSPVKALSGGERNRLLLARLFSKPSNVLVLDEPTNDLDLETLELLEELLSQYEGTLLLVSHDRSFLNNVVTSTLVFEGNGVIKEYVGGYDDWLRQRPAAIPASVVKATTPPKAVVRETPPKNTKLVRDVEQKIEKLEALQQKLQVELSDPELYLDENSQLGILQEKLRIVEEELTALYETWEKLF